MVYWSRCAVKAPLFQQVEVLPRAVFATDSPTALLQQAQDVRAVDVLEVLASLLASLDASGRVGASLREGVLQLQDRARREDHGSLDDVSKLQHVARPVVGDQSIHHWGD